MITISDTLPKTLVLGTGVTPTAYSELTGKCRDWIAQRRSGSVNARGKYVCFLSVHGLITAHDDAEFQSVLNAADIVSPDGMPIVWALRSFGYKSQERVYGPTAMLSLCEDAERYGHRLFLYGGTERSLSRLVSRLQQHFPRLQVVGAYSPPFRPLTDSEDRALVQALIESDADMVFVGISTPKQERWMADHVYKLPGVVLAGVGAAFDFHAGVVKQAPHRLQRLGLEWLFRLLMEPRRLWRRYVLVTPRFLPLWFWQWLTTASPFRLPLSNTTVTDERTEKT